MPPHQEREELAKIARAGLDVRIVAPAFSDVQSAVYAARAAYGDLLEAGAHIYEMRDAVVHAKLAVVDDTWTVVGSSNLDRRSVVFNNEVDAVILGHDTAAQVETVMRQFMAASHEVDLSQVGAPLDRRARGRVEGAGLAILDVSPTNWVPPLDLARREWPNSGQRDRPGAQAMPAEPLAFRRVDARTTKGSAMPQVTLTVNGKQHTVEVEGRTLLVELLREKLGLTGTHVGCDTSQCGACVVHIDGISVKSCTQLALQADGTSVLTIEGLAAADGTLHPMQEMFREHHALQCGFCTPGMVMTAVDLVQSHPDGLTEKEIREGLEGNLCRCTGYHNIVKAIAAAHPLMHAKAAE